MRRQLVVPVAVLAAAAVTFGFSQRGQRGPFDPEKWPPTIDAMKTVHYISTDGALQPPSGTWAPNLKFLTGGDHATEKTTAGGKDCVRIAMFKFNTADDAYATWANEHSVDVLIQFWGDDKILDEKGAPRYFNFLTGTLPEPIAMDGGEIPASANNGKWNWALFRVSNGLRHMDGGRLIGTIHPKAKGDTQITEVSRLSGQNGGTIRLDGLPNVKIRVVAFGQKGAFGHPGQINRFEK